MMPDEIDAIRSRFGQGIVEYALLLGLIAVAVAAMLIVMAQNAASAVSQTSAGFQLSTTESEDLLHVSSIEMSARSEGPFVRVSATVNVVDQDAAAARGATVTVAWSIGHTESDTTDGRGRARFSYRSRDFDSGQVVSITVEGIEASDADYDAGSNLESSDEITVP